MCLSLLVARAASIDVRFFVRDDEVVHTIEARRCGVGTKPVVHQLVSEKSRFPQTDHAVALG